MHRSYRRGPLALALALAARREDILRKRRRACTAISDRRRSGRGKATAPLPPARVQNGTGGPCHAPVSGRARAIASGALRKPSQALRPGRRRQRLSSPLQRA